MNLSTGRSTYVFSKMYKALEPAKPSNLEMSIPCGGRLGTSPLNQGQFEIFAFVVNSSMNVVTSKICRYFPFCSWSEPESETLLVDNKGEVYVIGLVDGGRGMVSHIPSSAFGSGSPVSVNSFVFVPIHTHHHDPLGGDISADGQELILKCKNHIYYFRITEGDVMGSMRQIPAELPYHRESNGQAICWSADGKNYYTLSEGHNKQLYFYRRVEGPIVG